MIPVSGKRIAEVAQNRGWFFVSRKGSHVKLRNPITGAMIIIPLHGNRNLAPGTQRTIMRQTGLTDEDLRHG